MRRGLTLFSLIAVALSPACGGRDATSGRDAQVRRVVVGDGGHAGHAAAPVDPGPRRAMAKRFAAYVRSTPRANAPRLGYIRAGAIVRTKSGLPTGVEDCIGGWYELEHGGFVCNGYDVVVFDGRRLPFGRGRQPQLDDPLPYEYGSVRREAPMYRRLPTDDEAVIHEGYVIPGTEPAPGTEDSAGDSAEEPVARTSIASEVEPSGGPAAPAEPSGGPANPPAAAATVAATNPASGANSAAAASATPAVSAIPSADAPAEDPGQPTLSGLQGERGSVVLRRLMPGFILTLDRTLRTGERRYWRTQSAGFVPAARVGRRQSSTEFHGVALDGAEWQLPVAFQVERGAAYYQRDPRGRMRTARGRMGYHDFVRVLGRETVDGTEYLAVSGDRFLRSRDVVLAESSPRPADVAETDFWIDVDLTKQLLVAYNGEQAVYTTLLSSGRPGNGDENFRTPPGNYRIISKHVTTTMDGDSASDGPYSIDDVPYVMFFFRSYALHGAFWHDRFGHVKSHGCVNLAPLDARWLFRWAPPIVEDGWHGAFATEDRPGAWVIVHGEPPE